MNAADIAINGAVGIAASLVALPLANELAPHLAWARQWRARRAQDELALLSAVEEAPAIGAGLAAYSGAMMLIAALATAAAGSTAALAPRQPLGLHEVARETLRWMVLGGAYIAGGYWRDLLWCRAALVDPADLRGRIYARLARLEPKARPEPR